MVTSQRHLNEKRPCYVSNRVCVVLCVPLIVSASCESSDESLSWLLHRLWQNVTPRIYLWEPLAVSSFMSVSKWECTWDGFVVVSSHVHVTLPLWPPATFCLSLRGYSSSNSGLSPKLAALSYIYCFLNMSICTVCLCIYIHYSEHMTTYICRKHLNVPDRLLQCNSICRLNPVSIM